MVLDYYYTEIPSISLCFKFDVTILTHRPWTKRPPFDSKYFQVYFWMKSFVFWLIFQVMACWLMAPNTWHFECHSTEKAPDITSKNCKRVSFSIFFHISPWGQWVNYGNGLSTIVIQSSNQIQINKVERSEWKSWYLVTKNIYLTILSEKPEPKLAFWQLDSKKHT